MKNQITGIIPSDTAVTTSGALRQPEVVTSDANHGRNTNCPVAVLAVSNPITSPRCFVNHRFATAAPSTVAARFHMRVNLRRGARGAQALHDEKRG
jgi:hypothetical protein